MVGCVGLPVFSLSPDYLPYEHVLPCLTYVTPLEIQLRINKVCHVIVRLGISTRRIDTEPFVYIYGQPRKLKWLQQWIKYSHALH